MKQIFSQKSVKACGERIGLNPFPGPVMQILLLLGLNSVLACMICSNFWGKTLKMLEALTVSAAVWSYELWSQSETSHLPSPSELRFWSDGAGYLRSVNWPRLHVLRPPLWCIYGSVWSISFSRADNSSVWMSLSLPNLSSVDILPSPWRSFWISLPPLLASVRQPVRVGVWMMLKFSCKCHR